jgi:hypothetical protein
MPRTLLEGVLALGACAGIVLPLALALALSDDGLLLPSGGTSVIAAFGEGGGVVEPGVNFGVAALFFKEGARGLRAGITWYLLRGSGELSGSSRSVSYVVEETRNVAY